MSWSAAQRNKKNVIAKPEMDNVNKTAKCHAHALIVEEAVKVWFHRAFQSYHLTLPLAVDVAAAYLSAGGH